MAKKPNDSRSQLTAESGGAAPAQAKRTRTVRAKPVATNGGAERKDSAAAVETTSNHNSSDRDEIAKLAYLLWEARGGQGGSPEEDWLRAEQEYRERASAATAGR